MPNVRLDYFSSGIEERNVFFVEQLLKLALSTERYEEIKDSVPIASRSHLKKTDAEDNYEKKERYAKEYVNMHSGGMKKDLRSIFPECDLAWSILIDDDYTYSAFEGTAQIGA